MCSVVCCLIWLDGSVYSGSIRTLQIDFCAFGIHRNEFWAIGTRGISVLRQRDSPKRFLGHRDSQSSILGPWYSRNLFWGHHTVRHSFSWLAVTQRNHQKNCSLAFIELWVHRLFSACEVSSNVAYALRTGSEHTCRSLRVIWYILLNQFETLPFISVWNLLSCMYLYCTMVHAMNFSTQTQVLCLKEDTPPWGKHMGSVWACMTEPYAMSHTTSNAMSAQPPFPHFNVAWKPCVLDLPSSSSLCSRLKTTLKLGSGGRTLIAIGVMLYITLLVHNI